MHQRTLWAGTWAIWVAALTTALSWGAPHASQEPAPPADDPAASLVQRLDLERFKATIKGLTQFGDRRQGTDRNRAAVDWIEAQLRSYGCPTERMAYEYVTPPPAAGRGAQGRGIGPAGGGAAMSPGRASKR